MDRHAVLLGGLLVLVGVIIGLTFLPARQGGPVAAPTGVVDVPGSARAGALASIPVAARAGADASRPSLETADTAVRTRREAAMVAWESLVDLVIEQKDVPASEQAPRAKAAFARLSEEARMEGLQRALNLLPDEKFPVLYAILFDKSQAPEVLDAIFSDALNRPEELKNPLMRELRKDREHPMYFESARILDAIGESQTQPASTAAP
jgi:hypothetical protein